MEWAKFGASCGLEVLKIVYDNKRTAELNEAINERNLYKQDVDRLKSQLNEVKRNNSFNGNSYKSRVHGNAYKPREHGNKSDFNRGYSQYSGNNSKQISQDQNSGSRKSFVGPGGHGQNKTFRGTQNYSISQKDSAHTSGTFSSSGVNERKAKSSISNFSAPRGGGSFHYRGRGRGRGNSHQ